MSGSRPAKIAILTGIHLCHNPRVVKEATTLAEAGHDVAVLGGWIDPGLKEHDRALMNVAPFTYKPVFDMSEVSLSNVVARVRNKVGAFGHRHGHESRWQLGYAYPALRRSAFRHQADLYIAHSEQGMAVAADLLRAGRRVGVDMEDWFSEDFPPDAPAHKPLRLIGSLENELLNGVAVAFCTSAAMSTALANAYGCRAPVVVYNAFAWQDRQSLDGERKDRRDVGRPSVHWFSQTLGRGRGLEDLIAALPLVDCDFELHLRGNADPQFRAWLAEKIPAPWRGRVFIHAQVAYRELLSRLAEHDVGFAGEMKYCRSRDLTVTNKLLHYLLAGLAVVASDTAGQREIAARAGEAVLLYPPGDPAALADRLNKLFGSPHALNRAKAAALRAAEQTFCWEREQPKLLAAVSRALR